MATVVDNSHCISCEKQKNTVKCGGCARNFCLRHMLEHHQELSEQLSHTEDQYNQFTNVLDEKNFEADEHPLVKQINQWEQESMEKIRHVANEVRCQALMRIRNSIADLNLQLKDLTEKLIQCREEDDFVDKDVQFFDEGLQRLKDILHTSPNHQLNSTSSPFIKLISLIDEDPMPRSIHLTTYSKWIQNAVTVAGGNGPGNALNQLDHPWGMCVNADRTVYVADSGNDRIMAWRQNATTGEVVAGEDRTEKRGNQLDGPTHVIIDHPKDSLIISDYGNRRVVQIPRLNLADEKTIISNTRCCGLAMDDDGALYVADYDRHEVRRYRNGEAQGTIVAGGNGSGNHLNQLHHPAYVFVDRDRSVYVTDELNDRVMKWLKDAKEGILVAGGHGEGNGLTQLKSPYGIVVDEAGSVYVADYSNHRIMRFSKNAREGSVVVGGNGWGNQPNQLYNPTSLSFDAEGHLYVLDQENCRVQRFNIDQS